ncbi:CPBP family intramembrane glutamic endopeptidase [Aquimarina sp. MMG016]|uniref:CPBP family intramembrane glutamic endopeptidase n=1 Tax=Aquimarina sp. MMG016 TaxID=2822690 RepID=UPI001B39D5F4|nr:CPBP family intramembrane glutamic endopeptidase [Aquimarina sp. MMG016]MBQ4819486.1 CPBP family intramembrane metalloprotease [Aquimarina sp. MMG016]
MYIEQAFKGQHDWWRYLVGLVIVFIFWQIIGVIPLMVGAFIEAGDLETFLKAGESSFMSLGMNSNLFLTLMIITFISGLIGLLIAIKFLHQQKFKEFTTTRKKVDWKRIWFAFLLVATVNIVFFGISYYMEPEIFTFNFKMIPFLILALISIFLLPLQTSFEEYLFRGYLMQGIGVLAKNKWLPLFITSITFGLLHSFNPEVEKLGYIMMVFYIGTGFLLGIMTLMDDGMELALGFHAANNMIAAMLVTTDWSAFQTNAIFLDTSEPSGGIDIVLPVIILYPVYLLIFAKKYKWTNWKGKLFGKVEDKDKIEVITNF